MEVLTNELDVFYSFRNIKNKNNMIPKIGITEDHLKAANTLLSVVLSDEMTLYVKTRKFHWNVAGESFMELHKLFEAQYTELELVIDEVAERISKLGGKAIGTMNEFTLLSRIKVNNAKQRVVQYLLALESENPKDLMEINFNYSKSIIASYLNIKPETFSRILKKLKKDGEIATNKNKMIPLLSSEENSFKPVCDNCNIYITKAAITIDNPSIHAIITGCNNLIF